MSIQEFKQSDIAFLTFRPIKEKERAKVTEYAFETSNLTNELGVSLTGLRRIYSFNRLLFGIPLKMLVKNMKTYVADINGEIAAGFFTIYDKKEEKYILGNVFTRPHFQGRGIGNKILQKVIKDFGDQTITLNVERKNEIAIHLYEKYGFVKKRSIKEYLFELPLKTRPFPSGYSARVAIKDDLKKISRLSQEIENMENLPIIYKKSFNKEKKRWFRLQNQIPAVLIGDADEIVGIGRVLWSKSIMKTAEFIATAVLPEAKEAYPSFISFMSEQVKDYASKGSWVINKKTNIFKEEMEPYLGVPMREGWDMVREPE